MNERLRELMCDAGYAAPELASRASKLAELVVRKCAKFLEENSGYDNSNNAWHPEPEDLLKHFGVE